MKTQWWIWTALAGIGLSVYFFLAENIADALIYLACLLLPVSLVLFAVVAHRRMVCKRLFWMRLAAVVISSTFAFVLAEVGYRLIRYRQIRQEYFLVHASATDPVLNMPWDKDDSEHHRQAHLATVFDGDIGFRFRPGFEFEAQPPGLPLRKWRVNSRGHISDEEYPVAKPADEFRIITIGDSFTDGYSNTIRWQAVLQKRLNENPTWRKFVGEKFTRVLNLGMNGIGIGQFRAVFDFEGQKFEPDVVVLNFITDDIKRRWYAKGHIRTKEDAETHYRANVLDHAAWFRIYPELLASTRAGKVLGLKSHLDLQLLNRYYESDAEGIQVSADAVKHIVQRLPRTLLSHHPEYEELKSNKIPDLVRAFEAALGETKICFMSRFLAPLKKDDSSYDQWYQLPVDHHPSDLGQEIYGEAMEKALVERFAVHP